MEEQKKSKIENLKAIGKKIIILITLCLTVLGGFFVGYLYNRNTIKIKPIKVNHINRSEVNLAIDQHNNLIVIDKKSGNYKIYDDSIGVAIFKLYARNISH